LKNNKAIELPDGNKARQFASIEDLKEWISYELVEWQWIYNTNQSTDIKSIFNQFYQTTIKALLDRFLAYAEMITNEQNNEENDSTIREMYNEIRDITTFWNFPFSDTPLGKYILDLKNEHESTAVALCIIATPIRSVPTSNLEAAYKKQYSAWVTPVRHQIGWAMLEPYRTDAMRHYFQFQTLRNDAAQQARILTITETTKQASSILNNLKSIDQGTQKWINDTTKKTSESLDAAQDTYKERSRSILRKVIRRSIKDRRLSQKIKDTTQDEITNARDAYRSQIEFDDTVQYWSTKEGMHNKSKGLWLNALISSAGTMLAACIIVNLIPNGWLTLGTETQELILGLLHPVKVILSLLLISLGSYAIRFCSHQYSTQNHLYLEAVERQTMMKTYIGLMTNGKLNEQEDRKVALNTIFRPSNTGIVSDMGAVMPTDSIIKVFDSQSKRTH